MCIRDSHYSISIIALLCASLKLLKYQDEIKYGSKRKTEKYTPTDWWILRRIQRVDLDSNRAQTVPISFLSTFEQLLFRKVSFYEVRARVCGETWIGNEKVSFFLNESTSREEKEVFLWVFCSKRELLSTKAAFLLCFFDVFEKGRKTTTTTQKTMKISSYQTHRILCECGYK